MASVAFVRRPSYRDHRLRLAGIRNPSRKRSLGEKQQMCRVLTRKLSFIFVARPLLLT